LLQFKYHFYPMLRNFPENFNRKITSLVGTLDSNAVCHDISTNFIFSARCNIYISRLCHDASLSVRLSVTEVHWRIIANLGFKFRSHFTAHWPPCCCGRRAAGGRRAACGLIISRHASQC